MIYWLKKWIEALVFIADVLATIAVTYMTFLFAPQSDLMMSMRDRAIDLDRQLKKEIEEMDARVADQEAEDQEPSK